MAVGRCEFLIDDDAVRHKEPSRRGELPIGHDADADEDEVGGQPRAIDQLDVLDPAITAGDPRDLRAKAELDALAAVRFGKKTRGVDRQDPAHRPVGQFDDVHLSAVAARDRGEFKADEPGADHHDVVRRGEPVAQQVGLGEGAQITDAVELDPGQRRHPVARAGGEHEMAVAEALARGKTHGSAHPVDLAHPGSREVVDAVVVVEGIGPHQEEVEADLAVEIILRQWRALVGQHRFVADQGDRALVAVLAERGGQLKAGMTGPDDDDWVEYGHWRS